MRRWVLFVSIAARALAADFYVSPTGTAGGDGSTNAPWTLAKGLTNPATVVAGSTLWLRGGSGGSYGVGGSNIFTVTISGTSNSPVIVRQYPGERAVIDGSLSGATAASNVWLWGFEVTCSGARTNNSFGRPSGPTFNGVGIRCINMHFRDLGNLGFGSFKGESGGSEVYGCLITGTGVYQYDLNGDIGAQYTTNSPWTRGSGLYLQNQYGPFLVANNVSIRNLTTGMKGYSESGYANDFIFSGNFAAWNGGSGIEIENLSRSITNASVINNVTFITSGNQWGYFGNDLNSQHLSLFASNNYMVGQPGFRNADVWLKRWTNVFFFSNTIITVSLTNELSAGTGMGNNGSGKFIDVWPATNTPALTMLFKGNNYFGGVEQSEDYFNSGDPDFRKYQPFRYKEHESEYSWDRWTSVLGFDTSDSTYTTNLPVANVTFLTTNKYEQGRAHLAVVNWEQATNLTYSLSLVGLTHGQKFEIRDAQNFEGTPVAMGYYNASAPNVVLPLYGTNGPVTAPSGDGMEMHATHKSSLFNVFVIMQSYRAIPNGQMNAAQFSGVFQ